MKAKYLGLDLSSPIVVSSSPYTATVSNIEQCVRNGAGAVVLKSIFEEQIYRQAASLDRMEGYGDAGEYLERYLGEAYKAELLELVSDAAKTGIPVIGSINCAGAGDAWIEYAAAMQQARDARSFGRKSYPLKVWGTLVGQLLIRTFDRAERISRAMLARGFTGRIPEGMSERPAWKMRDTLFLAAWCSALVLLRLCRPAENFSMLINNF